MKTTLSKQAKSLKVKYNKDLPHMENIANIASILSERFIVEYEGDYWTLSPVPYECKQQVFVYEEWLPIVNNVNYVEIENYVNSREFWELRYIRKYDYFRKIVKEVYDNVGNY